jgi:hypothetical protein
MPDSHDRTEKSDNTNAQERARAALERGVAEIKTPAQARRALSSLEKTAGDLREKDVAGLAAAERDLSEIWDVPSVSIAGKS